MAVISCSVAGGAVTTGANYTWDETTGTVQALQNIDFPRQVAEWQLSVPLVGLQVLNFVAGPAGRCVVGNSDITIGVQVDGLLGFAPQGTADINLTLTILFESNFNRVHDGHLLSEDDWGGLTVTPWAPLGSGRLPRWSMVTQGPGFPALNATDTNTTEAVPPGWRVSWQLSPGERIFMSVMPMRPYDWAASFADVWTECTTAAQCRTLANLSVPQAPLLKWGMVMWHVAVRTHAAL